MTDCSLPFTAAVNADLTQNIAGMPAYNPGYATLSGGGKKRRRKKSKKRSKKNTKKNSKIDNCPIIFNNWIKCHELINKNKRNHKTKRTKRTKRKKLKKRKN